MKPIDMIVKALATGALIEFRPNSASTALDEDEILDEYMALKELIQLKSSKIDADLLEPGPDSVERRQLLATQLEAAGAAADEAIVAKAQHLLDLIAEKDPESLWASQIPETPPHLK